VRTNAMAWATAARQARLTLRSAVETTPALPCDLGFGVYSGSPDKETRRPLAIAEFTGSQHWTS
jgi:hypothetical protein